tara:strand:- start:347 stop:577 length:231 start_codon:yes stop_codon:yes gene_type:complete
MEGCPWCVQFEDMWDKLNQKIKNVKFMKVNGPQNSKLAKKYDIQSYPTLVLVKSNKSVKFENKRTYPNIVKFINKM